jgi:methyl-accepting chemotaxis protein
MSALSIRAKVIAVIAFMLIAMSGMGLLAIHSMQVINTHTVEIASSWLPSVRVLGELRADINLFRIALRAHVMAETLEAKAANDKRLAGILERIAKDRKAYEPMITSPQRAFDLPELGECLGQVHHWRPGSHRVVAREHRADSS